MIVVDASAILELLLCTPAGITITDRVLAPRELPCAPDLLDIEVTQVLRRYAASGELDDRRGREALADLGDLPLERYPHDVLLPRIWALRANVSAYDGVYIALAEALDAPLLTRDTRLAAAPGHRASIELV